MSFKDFNGKERGDSLPLVQNLGMPCIAYKIVARNLSLLLT